MKRILFIDDDRGPMELYVEALTEAGFSVEYVDTVDGALDVLDRDTDPANVFILDVMMPVGNRLDIDETYNGLTTGIRLYQRIRAKYPVKPIVALTNVKMDSIPESLPANDPMLRICAKIDFVPSALVSVVKGLVDAAGG